jgi:hypothetical protein
MTNSCPISSIKTTCIQLFAALFLGWFFAIFGLIIGAEIGDALKFPSLGITPPGYESGGVLFSFIGITFGSIIGIITAQKIIRIPNQLHTSVATGVILFFLLIFLHFLNISSFFITYMLPSFLLTFVQTQK